MKMLNFFIDKKRLEVFIIVTLLSAAFNLHAEQQKPTQQNYTRQQIEQMAVDYIRGLFPAPDIGEVSYAAVKLDGRIKIKPCDYPLHLSIPGHASLSKKTTVLIRCEPEQSNSNTSNSNNIPATTAKNWNLYVQVAIATLMPVVVTRMNLSPGSMLTKDNIAVMLIDNSQVRGKTLQETDLLIGAKTSVYMRAGDAVTLKEICLVCEGDSVTIIVKIKGLQVKTSGIAQQNGSLGDNIAILNSSTNKRIEAKVVAVNLVEVNI